MTRGLWTACILIALAVPWQPADASECRPQKENTCQIRKRQTCGPVRLEHGIDRHGEPYCNRVTLQLPSVAVMPMLRRVRCALFGEDTDVRLTAQNYLPKNGPAPGDTIRLRNGGVDFVLSGAYETSEQRSEVYFENMGPGEKVVLRCSGFGPA